MRFVAHSLAVVKISGPDAVFGYYLQAKAVDGHGTYPRLRRNPLCEACRIRQMYQKRHFTVHQPGILIIKMLWSHVEN
jgi:hypothetical protein